MTFNILLLAFGHKKIGLCQAISIRHLIKIDSMFRRKSVTDRHYHFCIILVVFILLTEK